MKTEQSQNIGGHKRKALMFITATLIASLLVTAALAVQTNTSTVQTTRNLKPGVDFSGPHFNLNLHGVPSGVDKFSLDSIGDGRHSIFVPLSAEIGFSIEYAFSYTQNWTVVDCDATGDGTASIILPAYMYVDTNNDGIEEKKQVAYYMCYLAGLGKPADDSVVIINPAATYNASWTAFQLNQNELDVTGHRKGAPVWYNGTDLFFADVTYYNGTDYINYVDQWIFDIPGLEGYWWQMTNNGVKLLQVRFYPVFR